MNRRTFVAGLGAALVAPVAAEVQAAARVPRIGTLWPAPASAPTIIRVTDAFKQGLEQLGYIEGKTVTVEYRYAEQEQMSRAAYDLVGLKVDIIVTAGTPAKRATAAIPIVGGVLADAVADGLVGPDRFEDSRTPASRRVQRTHHARYVERNQSGGEGTGRRATNL